VTVRGARLVPAMAVALVACAAGTGAASSSRVVVETAEGARHTVRVELARNDAERARGLMYREKLDEDAGMLFLFPVAEDHGFWMKNTLIPLDMLFIGEDGRIVGIVEKAAPHSTNPRSVGAPSQFVLEVNGGWCARHGVKKGDRVRFEQVPRF
jgi:uncharacterized membrane protein (UPF0127 family)